MWAEKTVKATGFLHYNTPVNEVKHNTDRVIEAADLKLRSRVETVTVDATIKWWRQGLDDFRISVGAKPLSNDLAEEAEVLELTEAPTLTIKANHVFQGETTFQYQLRDCVSGVFLPMFYKKVDEAKGSSALSGVEQDVDWRFTHKSDLSSSEQAAYDKLVLLFKKGSTQPVKANITRSVLKISRKRGRTDREGSQSTNRDRGASLSASNLDSLDDLEDDFREDVGENRSRSGSVDVDALLAGLHSSD
jgi:hypothetical protein